MVFGQRLSRFPESNHTSIEAFAIMRQWTYVALLITSFLAFVSPADISDAALDGFSNGGTPANFMSSLGVRAVAPMYAVIPMEGKNLTVSLTLWLRRVGATGSPYGMPHQSKDAIRILVWVDNPADLQLRKYGHLLLPAEQGVWQPELLLETVQPGPILPAKLEYGKKQINEIGDPRVRPYTFRVELPAGAGNCFKVIETSYPKHKAPLCLPPAAGDGVCATLAPATQYTDMAPALWFAIGPTRDFKSTRDWRGFQISVATRVSSFLSYHIAMNTTGLLLYVDELMRLYLMNIPDLRQYVEAGTLRLIDWLMNERAHDDNDGRGRPLGYNYDQALFAGHALLGLSACGANLMLVMTDLDEFLYTPQPGIRWPEPYKNCLSHMNTEGKLPIAQFKLQRVEVVSTKWHPVNEHELWSDPGRSLPRFVSAVSGGDSGVPTVLKGTLSPRHPLAEYDWIYKEPLSLFHTKPVIVPAAEHVLFFVHEGVPVHGRSQLVDISCLTMLHVVNQFKSRRNDSVDHTYKLREFRHWLFSEDGASFKGAGH
ncbi:hypothetical protein Agub_g4174 [Astrephomene gubernaculifera]|uniref:Glycosyltransferase family 92 protein n=1 Tax=Astrephomene gubernaculifera TaxID=47775 RepID=A0AAD3DJU7_9CHLO|nr:hypothetical protein Agub_g4174 [Astrephomene gubernaculifera]